MRAHMTAGQQRARAARSPERARQGLPAAIGNRAFCEFVARSRVQRTGVAAEPRTVVTAFGTFEVHPGGEPLPVAEPGAGQVWPISESLFARLQASMDAIGSNQGALRVVGRR